MILSKKNKPRYATHLIAESTQSGQPCIWERGALNHYTLIPADTKGRPKLSIFSTNPEGRELGSREELVILEEGDIICVGQATSTEDSVDTNFLRFLRVEKIVKIKTQRQISKGVARNIIIHKVFCNNISTARMILQYTALHTAMIKKMWSVSGKEIYSQSKYKKEKDV